MKKEIIKKALIAKTGGTASKNSYMVRVSLPKEWIKDWEITKENADLKLTLEENKIIIEKV